MSKMRVKKRHIGAYYKDGKIRVKVYKILKVEGRVFLFYPNPGTSSRKRLFWAGDTILDEELEYLQSKGVEIEWADEVDEIIDPEFLKG